MNKFWKVECKCFSCHPYPNYLYDDFYDARISSVGFWHCNDVFPLGTPLASAVRYWDAIHPSCPKPDTLLCKGSYA